MKELIAIQKNLVAPKNQYNSFGKYKYRSCEDILKAVKPLLNGCILTITDEMVEVGGRIYVKSTATLNNGKESVSTCGWAREAEKKKGMDSAQVTGATSSYSRKYAINGLFAIDDTKDSDVMNRGDDSEKPTEQNDKKETTSEFITDKQRKNISTMVADTNSDVDQFLKFAGAVDFATIPSTKYDQLVAMLNKKAEVQGVMNTPEEK